jgi:hypothetical protein
MTMRLARALAGAVPDGVVVVGPLSHRMSWLTAEEPALPVCLVVVRATAGADRASFPGLGDPAGAGPVAQLVRAHA